MAPKCLSLFRGNATHEQRRIDVENLLSQLCTPPTQPFSTSEKAPQISSEKFVEIAGLLGSIDQVRGQSGALTWSERPRTYTVLRNISRLDLLDAFAKQGLTDFNLPYSDETLPQFLKDRDLRDNFLAHQRYVLTDARTFEEPGGAHVSIDGNAQQYFYYSRHLGHGGFGMVDEVISRLSLKSYARKSVLRGNNSENSRRAQRYLIEELTTLKTLSHRHLVRYIGSYTDKEHIAFLMDPVADFDLAMFLRSITEYPGRLASLRYFFGCLSGAVNYLHTSNIRHRDLKPNNILVKDGAVFITDFGAVYNTAKTRRTTTLDRNVPQTIQYMAPEVAVAESRPPNMPSDMWSLGVVFLEMSTILLGNSLRALNLGLEKLSKTRKTRPYVWDNIEAMYRWLESLRRYNKGLEQDNEVLTWTRLLLQRKPDERLTSVQLMQRISESPSFNYFCCYKCCPEFERSSVTIDAHETNGYTRVLEVENEVSTLFSGSQLRNLDTMEDERNKTIEDWITATYLKSAKNLTPLFNGRDSRSEEWSSLNFNIQQDTTHTPNDEKNDESANSDTESSPESYYSSISQTRKPTPASDLPTLIAKAESSTLSMDYSSNAGRDQGMNYKWEAMTTLEHNPWAEATDTQDIFGNHSKSNNSITKPIQHNGVQEIDSTISIENRQHQNMVMFSAYEITQTNVWDNQEEAFSISSPPKEHSEEIKNRYVDVTVYEGFEDNNGDSLVFSSAKPSKIATASNIQDDTEENIEQIIGKSVFGDIRDGIQEEVVEPNEKIREKVDHELVPYSSEKSRSNKDYSSKPMAEGENFPPEIGLGLIVTNYMNSQDFISKEKEKPIYTESNISRESISKEKRDHVTNEMTLSQNKKIKGSPMVESKTSKQSKSKEDDSLTQILSETISTDPGNSSKPIIVVKIPQRQAIFKPIDTETTDEGDKPVQRAMLETRPQTSSDKLTSANLNLYNSKPQNSDVSPTKDSKSKVVSTLVTFQAMSPNNKGEEITKKAARQAKLYDKLNERSAPKSEKLSLLNIALHNSTQKNSDAATNSGTKTRPYSFFNPQVYMETAWEAASTQITEKQDLRGINFNLWRMLDRDAHYLEMMCKEGKPAAVRWLLNDGCNPGTVNKPRPMPLIYAVTGGTPQHYKCVQALLQAGVNVNVTEPKTRKSALQLAIEMPDFKGHTNLVRDLAVSGAKINVQDKYGGMPIHSIFGGEDSTPLAKFRLDALACILRVDIHGDTEVNVSDRHDLNSTLHLAVRRNSSMAVGMLLYKGANVNAKNSIGLTPLFMATTQWAGRLSEPQEAVLNLLLRSPDINVNESWGFEKQTALHQAVLHASPSATRILLEYNADPATPDLKGRTAQDLAIKLDKNKWEQEKQEILGILREHKKTNNTW